MDANVPVRYRTTAVSQKPKLTPYRSGSAEADFDGRY